MKEIFIQEIVKIADLDKGSISTELTQGLFGKHSYVDIDDTMSEHLYSPTRILEDMVSPGIHNDLKSKPELVKELIDISIALAKVDCAYFRIVY